MEYSKQVAVKLPTDSKPRFVSMLDLIYRLLLACRLICFVSNKCDRLVCFVYEMFIGSNENMTEKQLTNSLWEFRNLKVVEEFSTPTSYTVLSILY